MVEDTKNLVSKFYSFFFRLLRLLTFSFEGATFLEFHHPLATFLHPELTNVAGTDTILKIGEVYENLVEIDILCKV